ncbi:tyrosine-type recombinase/integrase [Mesorhizobium sp. M0013]|uniref:tyrosine-type recombinase/integrase n=1 Tax=Mesorhizobium sp. M0013 TaxID=2956841 RepID=UPI003336F8D3
MTVDENMPLILSCHALPSKRARLRPGHYLEAPDIRAIIEAPDRRTRQGWRDYTLPLFLYNCGARVSEVTGLLWSDLQLMPPRQVLLRGKGRKERLVPIWSQTADALRRLHGTIPRSPDSSTNKDIARARPRAAVATTPVHGLAGGLSRSPVQAALTP